MKIQISRVHEKTKYVGIELRYNTEFSTRYNMINVFLENVTTTSVSQESNKMTFIKKGARALLGKEGITNFITYIKEKEGLQIYLLITQKE